MEFSKPAMFKDEVAKDDVKEVNEKPRNKPANKIVADVPIPEPETGRGNEPMVELEEPIKEKKSFFGRRK